MIMEPKVARELFPCPLARTFDEKRGPNCDADRCIMWRWQPLLTNDPGYKEAVKDSIGRVLEDGSTLTIKTAPGWVNANRATLGLHEKPYLGWCGLGGKPEA